MAQHCLTAHYGEEHVSAHEAGLVQSILYGSGRYKIDGLSVSAPSPFLLHVDNGVALIDGRWYLITGAGENLTIPPGSIGMQRRDRVFLRYYRDIEGVESIELEYVVGTPTTGSPVPPTNEHPASIFDQPTMAWIPFADVPVSGYTVGTPTMLLETRALTLPAEQCEMCVDLMREVQEALMQCRMATAEAEEVVRSIPDALADYDRRIKEIEDKVAGRLDLMEQEIRQLAAMLANNLATYVFIGDTLAAPTGWVEYNSEDESVKLAHTSYDEKENKFKIDQPITVDERVEKNTANVDYLLMLSGEE